MSRRIILVSGSLIVLLTIMACQVGGLFSPAPTPTIVPTPTTAPLVITPLPESGDGLPADGTVTLTLDEDDVEALVTQPEVAQQFSVENLDVTFDDGIIELTADRLVYSPLTINNLALTGTVTAEDGRPRLDVTRIQPNNLVTAAIPGVLTRLLEARTAGYYVEDIVIDDGTMTIRVKP